MVINSDDFSTLQHYKGEYFNPYANSLSQDYYKKQGKESN